MSRVEVNHEELRKAFRWHRNAARQCSGPSSLMSKFYAVECGLKSKYMKDQGLRSSEKLQGLFGADGHNLSAGIKLCGVPAMACPKPEDQNKAMDPPALHKTNGKTIQAHQAHQAWRYGAPIIPRSNETYGAWLDKIAEWLRKEIG